MKIKISEIKVKSKIIDEKELKAIINLDFGDFVIKGFRLQSSNFKNVLGDQLWLVPPSYPDQNRQYHPIFFIPNKNLWKELEKHILLEYRQQNKKYQQKKFGLNKDELASLY